MNMAERFLTWLRTAAQAGYAKETPGKVSSLVDPLKIELTQKVLLNLNNRDGEIYVGKSEDGKCFLIAGAGTFWNAEVFTGCGSTEHIEISEMAFTALVASVIPDKRPER
jgi:hypothetical protein